MLLVMWFGAPRISLHGAWHTSRTTYGVSLDSGSLYSSYIRFDHPGYEDATSPPGLEFWTQDNRKNKNHPICLFDPALVIMNEPKNGGLDLALWLILTVYTAVWLTTMVWWQRRKRRLMEAHAGPGLAD